LILPAVAKDRKLNSVGSASEGRARITELVAVDQRDAASGGNVVDRVLRLKLADFLIVELDVGVGSAPLIMPS
jgi:hypothetical protein